ncbi:YjbF family lipoprotein [Sinimarinibacterium flocculans]|uniref:YjbF family lipoprotein n=1 Tax=Sinimarinibacterium flocculans TaxID=985250 RepID=UPI0035173348
MRTDSCSVRRMLVAALLLPAMALGGCSTSRALRGALPGSEAPSVLGGVLPRMERLPYASMLLRANDRFEALLLLGHVGADGVQTWYGIDGLVVQLRDGRVIHTRGLLVDVHDSHAAGVLREMPEDCGAAGAQVSEWLHYTRLREHKDYFAEQRESIHCTRETVVTPAYSGPALRVEERIALHPHRERQARTRWFAEGSGQLLRLEYGEHPWYPQIALYLIKPVAPR